MKKALILALLIMIGFAGDSSAQMSAQKDARHIALLKAVIDIKINDEENLSDIEALRNNRRFHDKLVKMLDKLSNERTKDSKNRQVLKILEDAGEQIYNLLD